MNRADHTGYINAVRDRLAQEEVRVIATRIQQTDGLRWAEMHLEPQDCPRLNPDLGEVHPVVTWDEEQGWGICVLMDDQRRSPLMHHGVRVAPAPDTAAWWVIGHTLEAYPSREDGPFRVRHDPAPELEAVLTQFA